MNSINKTFIVANPAAAGGRVARQWHEVAARITEAFGLGDVSFTEKAGHGRLLTAQAIRTGAKRIVIVGGDGTVNECLNGYLDADGGAEEVELALFPFGTGGDFARSVGFDSGRRYLASTSARWVDVGRVTALDAHGLPTARHFINVASLGATGAIVERVNGSTKRFGARAAFVLGTLRGFAGYGNRRVRLRIDDEFEEELSMAVVAVGNGRYFGGGMKVAPNACIDDGVFEICVMGNIGAGAFIRHQRKLYSGTHGDLPEVRLFQGERIRVTNLDADPVIVESDGEVVGIADVSIEVIPGAVKLLAPWERAEATDRVVSRSRSRAC